MLEIQSLTKYYRNIPVVNDVSFSVRRGEVTGYLGPNGSGKSTTVKMITGMLEPTAGRVLLDGRDSPLEFNFTVNHDRKHRAGDLTRGAPHLGNGLAKARVDDSL